MDYFQVTTYWKYPLMEILKILSMTIKNSTLVSVTCKIYNQNRLL